MTRIGTHVLTGRLWRGGGFTAVLVMHDIQQAVLLADRVSVMEKGRPGVDVSIDLPRPRHRGPQTAVPPQEGGSNKSMGARRAWPERA
jgi:sulfonate transport system ATP-binding protein